MDQSHHLVLRLLARLEVLSKDVGVLLQVLLVRAKLVQYVLVLLELVSEVLRVESVGEVNKEGVLVPGSQSIGLRFFALCADNGLEQGSQHSIFEVLGLG